jgi:hypothetical protein
MRRWVYATALVTLAAGRAGAQTEPVCKLPPYVTGALGGARDGQMVSLGPVTDRVEDPFRGDPNRFEGYRPLESAALTEGTIARLRAALAPKHLVCAKSGAVTAPFGLGFDLAGNGGALRLVVLPGSGQVEFELPNGLRIVRYLSPAGLTAWNRCFEELAAQLRRTPEQLQRELTPASDALSGSRSP